jgi:hypothetical protein
VIGGYFDIEFEKETKILFQAIFDNHLDIVYSSVTEDELLNAPEQVRNLLSSLPETNKTRIELTEEVVMLADTYIAENVVGKTNSTAIKGFKAVDFMREVRDKISLDIQDMNFEEIRKYMEERRLKLTSINYSAPYTNVTESTVVAEPTATPLTEGNDDIESENRSN